MKKYYFLGIGGVSMSALAIMLKTMGNEVSGSDEVCGYGTELLEREKLNVDYVLNKKKILDADIIVCSSAIKENNKQYIFAKENNKLIISRGKLLGEIAGQYKKVIAVAGAHGKTTTTAMIYEILKYTNKNPTLHLGGYRLEDGLNFHLGDKEIFVTEACEYYDNFLNLYPQIGVVTNIEKEHLDYFKTYENLLNSFKQFKNQSKFVVDNLKNFEAKNISHAFDGRLQFDLLNNGKMLFHLNLQIYEEINVQNCIYAYQVAKLLGIEDEEIKKGLENYKGTKTRFEKVLSPYFENVICDYAHHPTEIEKSIKSAQNIYQDKKIIVIFQPHTFSRTKFLLNDFVEVFKGVDCPIFFKTYSAREKEEEGVSAEELMKNVKKINKNAEYFDNYQELKDFLLKFERKKTMLLFLGAGDLPLILHKNKFIS